MDAYLSNNQNSYLSNNQNSANIFDPPPILIAADTEHGKTRARATVMTAGLRVAEAVGLEDVGQRLARQAAASALWIELESGESPSLDQLLDSVAADVADCRYSAVIAAPARMLERLAPYAFDINIDLIIDAAEDERLAALAVAASGARAPRGVADATTDKNAARLRQLSDEVSRIASTLARLSTGPGASPHPPDAERRSDAPEVSIETVRAVIRARRLRSRYFPEDLFADPAWDMLLDLLQAEISKLRVPVSNLCIAAAVPSTTALRWLKTMVQEGVFVRRADPHDGRRVFVELAPQASHALRRYFAEVGRIAVI